MSIPSSSPRLYRWVESALTQFLLQVKVSLSEADASGPAGTMHRISGRFHHIQGLLEMAGLDAASLLARDLAQLSGKMADRPLDMDFDEGVIRLKRGLETLQDYRFSIENQSPWSPLVLVDEINAVRQISGGDPVCGYDLFHPPLDCDPKFSPRGLPELSSEDQSSLLANLRKGYRKALLSRLKHPEQDDSVTAMAQIMGHMQRVSHLETDQQFWWVAAGFMESLKGRRVDVVSGANVLFARLDNEMSRMQDAPVYVDNTPTGELLREMLYFIGSAGARPCCSGQVGRIKTAFGLNQWFPEETACSQPDRLEPLSGAEFSKKIGAGFFCKLESRLDRYLSGKLDGESTRALCADLDTLDQVSRETGLGEARRLIGALRSVIQDADTDPVQPVQAGGDHRIASSVSLLKEVLDDPGKVSARRLSSVAECESELYRLTIQGEKEGEEKGNRQDSTEYSRTREALLDDIDAMLADAGACGEAPHDLRQIEGHFNTMAGWFGGLNADRMAQLSENAAGVLSRIRTRGIVLDREKKEKIALVAVSIGLGSEPLEPIRPGAIVESARTMLESLAAGIDRLDSCPETPGDIQEGGAEPDRGPADDFTGEGEAVLTRLKAHLLQWRTHGISAEILGNIRSEFQALTSRASVCGHDEIVRLGCAVEQLLETNVGENSGTVGSSLLDVMEEVHDGLASDLKLKPGAGADHVRTLTKIVELLLPDGVINPEEASAHRVVNGENGAPVQNSPDMDHDMVRYADEFALRRGRLEVALAEVRQELEGLKALTQRIRDRLAAFEADEGSPPESGRQGDCAAGPVPQDRHFPMHTRIPEMIQQLERMSRVECQLSDGASDLEDILARQAALAGQLRKDFKSVQHASVSGQ